MFFSCDTCRLETSFGRIQSKEHIQMDHLHPQSRPYSLDVRCCDKPSVGKVGGGKTNSPELIKMDPIPSMYGIFSYIYHKNQPNVDKYSIHGSYGKWIEFPGKFSGANQTFTCYFINTFSIPVGRFQHVNPWKKHMLEPTNQPTNQQTNKQQTTNNKLEKIGTPGIRGKNTYMIEIKPPNEYMLMFPKIQRNLS